MFKKLVAFKVKYYNQTKIEFRFQNGLTDAIAQLRGALNRKQWKQDPSVKQFTNQIDKVLAGNVYTGMRDLQSLFQNAKELREISEYLKKNINSYDKTREISEADNILNDLGYYQIISKSTCLLSAGEVLQACQKFQQLGFNAKVNEYDGIKVIESTTYNENEDFQNNIGKYISYEIGVTAEQLAKNLKLSVQVTRIKLNKAMSIGKVILADRIEGKSYFKNIILDLK
ncbi:vacuolar sorting protein, putative [Ichthyophthirius multifiliis]|uniref:Vacuolar protein-sorting-associated protein 36 n=1 Tax=Ichthyophthirius multifiliis TaxID=5932 RepID=G0R0E8_ICHMU|nr:vacuolar sorting protein, putative [Ichthyophthirius multifiliis]EGR29057.1 vacuolar sorting protein, putative [Ichthyophthirius multifiliis]|eukprot:XP_004030293.1 vacuolar sorting protein, putative [Ichthyophthirius multifiliis]